MDDDSDGARLAMMRKWVKEAADTCTDMGMLDLVWRLLMSKKSE